VIGTEKATFGEEKRLLELFETHAAYVEGMHLTIGR
jgi:hypothetical protein